MRTKRPSSIGLPEPSDTVNNDEFGGDNSLLVPSRFPLHPRGSACGSKRRHTRRRAHTGTRRGITRHVASRLRDEGVPPADLVIVAREVERCVSILDRSGDDAISLSLHPWTVELLARYGDKLRTLLMTTRRKVERC